MSKILSYVNQTLHRGFGRLSSKMDPIGLVLRVAPIYIFINSTKLNRYARKLGEGNILEFSIKLLKINAIGTLLRVFPIYRGVQSLRKLAIKSTKLNIPFCKLAMGNILEPYRILSNMSAVGPLLE